MRTITRCLHTHHHDHNPNTADTHRHTQPCLHTYTVNINTTTKTPQPSPTVPPCAPHSWALVALENCLEADWPPALHTHELFEPVAITTCNRITASGTQLRASGSMGTGVVPSAALTADSVMMGSKGGWPGQRGAAAPGGMEMSSWLSSAAVARHASATGPSASGGTGFGARARGGSVGGFAPRAGGSVIGGESGVGYAYGFGARAGASAVMSGTAATGAMMDDVKTWSRSFLMDYQPNAVKLLFRGLRLKVND